MGIGSSLVGALSGLLGGGGPLGAMIGGIGGLLGGAGGIGAGGGGLGGNGAGAGAPDMSVQQMLQAMQQQNMQNLMFQQLVNQQAMQFATLSNAQTAMHNNIMNMLNNSGGGTGPATSGSGPATTGPKSATGIPALGSTPAASSPPTTPSSSGSGAGSSLFAPLQLKGPDFSVAAAALMRTTRVASIALLQVYPGSGTPNMQTLSKALASLKIYFVPKGGSDVFLFLPAYLVPPAFLSLLQATCGARVTLNPTSFQQVQLQQLEILAH